MFHLFRRRKSVNAYYNGQFKLISWSYVDGARRISFIGELVQEFPNQANMRGRLLIQYFSIHSVVPGTHTTTVYVPYIQAVNPNYLKKELFMFQTLSLTLQ